MNLRRAEKMIFKSNERMAHPSKRALSGRESTEESHKKLRINGRNIANDRLGLNEHFPHAERKIPQDGLRHFPHEERKIPHDGLGLNKAPPHEEVEIPHEELGKTTNEG